MHLNLLLSVLVKPWLDELPHGLESGRGIDDDHPAKVLWVVILIDPRNLLDEMTNWLAQVLHCLDPTHSNTNKNNPPYQTYIL